MAADAELMGRAAGPGRHRPAADRAQPVGRCVVVRDGEVVGEGATQPPGGAHAEIEALRTAGERARGATVYTTLEPCAHQGRTPPCATRSPRPASPGWSSRSRTPTRRSRGRAIAQLRDRGVTVDVGVGADDAARSLAPYLHQRRTRPRLRGAEDGHEPRRPHRGARRLVAVDHRRGVARRRPRAARRLAGRRGRRRHRARRPPAPHRSRRASPPCAPAAARAARRHRPGPRRRPAVRRRARAHAGRHHRRRRRRRRSRLAGRGRQGR